ncbi:MAG: DUF4118 domain-containing protein [Opitutaceae bacterium]
MTDPTPNPDALLASLKRDEARGARGRLKIFFGMCPGVGKTYAMLKAARRDRQQGADPLVGIVETHGRPETAALLEGLTVLPRRLVPYRGIELSDFDLEAALARRPALVLVDELAHTNAPGARHPKRFQDVIELLEAGIDVATTLNVQHLESRADAVAQIAGIVVTETVPDSIAELADEIELVDLTTEALLVRLREGKIYLGDRAAAAKDNFFQEARITALREIALRFTAERMDHRLRELRTGGEGQTVWRSSERLTVAVGPSPSSTRLVRWTRRMAAAQGAAWIAVHVESSRSLQPNDRRRLDLNLALARELGAEVVVTHDDDLAAALIRVALQNRATQIVVGKSLRVRWRDRFARADLPERLLRSRLPFDLHIVPAQRMAKPDFRARWIPPSASNPREYAEVALILAGVTLLGWLGARHIGYVSVGMLYLLGVLLLGLRVGRGPVLAAAVLSALAWNYLFIPPTFTMIIGHFADQVLFGIYFVAALVLGRQTARIKAQERQERTREQHATALLQLSKALTAARSLDEGVIAALRQIDELFEASSAVLLADEPGGRLTPHFAGSFTLSEKERAVAEWAFRHRRKAGRFTDTLPSAEGFDVPFIRDERPLGVLVVRVEPSAALTLPQRDLVESFSAHIAVLVDTEALRAAGERERLLAESERLHRTLLDGVSHELKTPLAVLGSVAENLGSAEGSLRDTLVRELRTATRRLNRLVDNLLDQSRLESGTLQPKVDWCDAADIVNAALDGVQDSLSGHPLELDLPPGLPPFRADSALMEQIVANLLLNAAFHTPGGTPIFLTAGVEPGRKRVFFTVADRGPGFPVEMRERLFQKFQRGDAARAGGLGLGLSIIRGFAGAQGGSVMVGENPGGGAVFTVYLPHAEPGAIPDE